MCSYFYVCIPIQFCFAGRISLLEISEVFFRFPNEAFAPSTRWANTNGDISTGAFSGSSEARFRLYQRWFSWDWFSKHAFHQYHFEYSIADWRHFPILQHICFWKQRLRASAQAYFVDGMGRRKKLQNIQDGTVQRERQRNNTFFEDNGPFRKISRTTAEFAKFQQPLSTSYDS